MITQTRRRSFKTKDGLSIYAVEHRSEGRDLLACWLGSIRPWTTIGYVIGYRGNWVCYTPLWVQAGFPIETTVKQAAQHIIDSYEKAEAA